MILMEQLNDPSIDLIALIENIQSLDSAQQYIEIVDLLTSNAYNYQEDTSSTSIITVINTLRHDLRPSNDTRYSLYHSIMKYDTTPNANNKRSRALINLKKVLTFLYQLTNKTKKLTKDEQIKGLNDKLVVLTNQLDHIQTLSSIEVNEELRENIIKAIVKSNLTNGYEIDIVSSTDQRNKDNDLVITRTFKFSNFAAGLLEYGLTLPRGSSILAKGGDGSTRFVRLLQGASYLIRASKELWSQNRVQLGVISMEGKLLRMGVDTEASQIINEGITQTLTTLINQAKVKSNAQVITSVLGALLRAGYPLEECVRKMYLILDTDKTKTITQELVNRSIMLIGKKLDKWNKLRLCPIYTQEELTNEINKLVGVGRGNVNKQCKYQDIHEDLKVDRKCKKCDFIGI